FSILLVIVGTIAGGRVAGDGVERLARSCACEEIAGLHHVCKIRPGVGSGVPGNRAGADGEVDVASGKYPPAVVSSGCRRGAARRQIGDRSIVPRIGAWIVAPGLVR